MSESQNVWIPSTVMETNQGVTVVNVRTKLLDRRRIFLDTDITSELAGQIVMQLMMLAEDSQEPIGLYINSSGGSVDAGLMIYDVMQSLKVPLNVYCTGMAASMAALLLAGGQKGRRFILPHSKTMIHEPLILNGVGGSATSISNISASILETKEITNGILARHTGKTLEEINEATAYDHYMNAQESVSFGLCDEIREGLF